MKNAVLRNDGLLTIWNDLTTEPAWKYEESPPFLLSRLIKVDLFETGDSELSRAIWFWFRRPKLAFHDSAALVIVALCVVYFFVHRVGKLAGNGNAQTPYRADHPTVRSGRRDLPGHTTSQISPLATRI